MCCRVKLSVGMKIRPSLRRTSEGKVHDLVPGRQIRAAFNEHASNCQPFFRHEVKCTLPILVLDCQTRTALNK